jgi:hypothetical protein
VWVGAVSEQGVRTAHSAQAEDGHKQEPQARKSAWARAVGYTQRSVQFQRAVSQ